MMIYIMETDASRMWLLIKHMQYISTHRSNRNDKEYKKYTH